MSKKTPQPQKTYEEAALPDKPSPKHTILIHCATDGCSKTRWVKPQDVFQVKFCTPCRDEQKGKKLAQTFKKLKEKVQEKVQTKALVERVKAMLPRLQVMRFHWPTKKEMAALPRLRRIWP